MDKQIFIQVHKLEQEALDAIEKLRRQGFRDDQVSVLAYNTERFNTLFKPNAAEAAIAEEAGVTEGELPDAVQDALKPPIAVPPPVVPGLGVEQPNVAPVGPVVPVSLGKLGLAQDDLLAHERSLESGDILVILQTDEGQEYRPDLPLIH